MDTNGMQLLDVRIDDVSLEGALEVARKLLDERAFHQVVTPGPEFLLEASEHERFRTILNRSDLSLPDGIGLKWAARLTGRTLKHRVAGVDFVIGLMELAAERGDRVFLYGGRPGSAERAVMALLQQFPKLQIVGYESGWRGPWARLHERGVIEKIHRAKPIILLVALGAPKQELWIDHHRKHLHDVRLAIGVGRTFDYLAGILPRPPKLMRRFGLEWLYTLLFASRFHDPQIRRQRVANATWHFLRTAYKRRHG